MSVASFLAAPHTTAFSFEVLPPPKGRSIEQIYQTIDRLREFEPAYVNITTHRSEIIYRQTAPDVYIRVEERHRPGTVAIAAAIRAKYGLPTVPHVICAGYSQQETEYELIDLAYLGITDIVVLRGDKGKTAPRFVATEGGLTHADQLCRQVADFNRGLLIDGSHHEMFVPTATADGRLRTEPFSYGVAGYPELHEEALSAADDLARLKQKVDAGAGYVVTQMFFDNSRYFDFVARCRAAGITVPIVPGIKPLATMRHIDSLPRTFHLQFPEPLRQALARCHTNDDVKAVGVEWAIEQCRELHAAGVPSIHFYTMNTGALVAQIARAVY